MYSIVMISALAAGPATPDFCGKGWGGYGHWHGSGWGGYPLAAAPLYHLPPCGVYGGYAFTGLSSVGPYGPATPGAAPAGNGPPPSSLRPLPPIGTYPSDRTGEPEGLGPIRPSTPGGISAAGPVAATAVPVTRSELVVRVPAGARLKVGGQPTDQTGVERVFHTPTLTPDQDYEYTLTAEFPDGRTAPVQQQVVVRAGHRTTVDFPAPTTASEVTVNLPAGARLSVDGQAVPTTGGRHTFRTPDLAVGREYAYEFRAEVSPGETRSRRVTFRAGDAVAVDLTTPPTPTQTAGR